MAEVIICCDPDVAIFGTLDIAQTLYCSRPPTRYCEGTGIPCETDDDCDEGFFCVPDDGVHGASGYVLDRAYGFYNNGAGNVEAHYRILVNTCAPVLEGERAVRAGDRIVYEMYAQPGILGGGAGGDALTIDASGTGPNITVVTGILADVSGRTNAASADGVTLNLSATADFSVLFEEMRDALGVVRKPCLIGFSLYCRVQVVDILGAPAPVIIEGSITINAAAASSCCTETVFDTE